MHIDSPPPDPVHCSLYTTSEFTFVARISLALHILQYADSPIPEFPVVLSIFSLYRFLVEF